MRSGLARQVVGCGVPWLVERQIRAARQLNRGEEPPALVADRVGDLDAPGGQVCQRLLDIFAHQVELVLPQPVSGVDGDLGWRQLEDQPTVTGVDPGKSEHVADEDPVGLRVGAVENDMCSVNHVAPSLSSSSTVSSLLCASSADQLATHAFEPLHGFAKQGIIEATGRLKMGSQMLSLLTRAVYIRIDPFLKEEEAGSHNGQTIHEHLGQ